MNLLLLEECDLTGDNTAIVRERRHRHMVDIKGAGVGDTLPAGILNGATGTATITAQSADSTTVSLALNSQPPAPLPLTLVLALPRPKMLRRILRMIAELGIKELHLINSFKVEKSYWQSPLLAEAAIREYFIAGLEQVGDTALPTCTLHTRFRPFVEDTLPGLLAGRAGVLADPQGTTDWPDGHRQPALLAIGPEGGFIPFERELLLAQGLKAHSLGNRIYRVETAVPLATAALFPVKV
ncbi:MAG: 16S rRNA (uracil(1498)-N(3))-methyltransferase [Gammaproteobacteria bacterium]|nr:MAG: 16S rRNA (uracil(1498)-N(3))-methyltransferase [Gammaproteobacteria bacterium]